MSDTGQVNAQIIDMITQSQLATMTPQVVLTSGAGKAYQAVAQSAAIAIQDATDALRNATTVANAASATALSQFLASGDPRYLEALPYVGAMIDKAIADFRATGTAASDVLKSFPSG
jgi:hypothetical protein